MKFSIKDFFSKCDQICRRPDNIGARYHPNFHSYFQVDIPLGNTKHWCKWPFEDDLDQAGPLFVGCRNEKTKNFEKCAKYQKLLNLEDFLTTNKNGFTDCWKSNDILWKTQALNLMCTKLAIHTKSTKNLQKWHNHHNI